MFEFTKKARGTAVWVLRAPGKLTGMARYRYMLRKNWGGCQVQVAFFIYGPQTCGVVATRKVSALDTGEPMKVCEDHYADYKRLEREAVNGSTSGPES